MTQWYTGSAMSICTGNEPVS